MTTSIELTPLNEDSLPQLVSGSVTIVGSPINLDLNWTYDSNAQTVSLSLTLQGYSLGNATLSPANLSATFSHSFAHLVKASITVTFNPSGPSLSVTGSACHMTWKGWSCQSVSANIPV